MLRAIHQQGIRRAIFAFAAAGNASVPSSHDRHHPQFQTRATTTARHHFQPFSQKDEEDLVKVITTKPRHVLKHVRQLVWRGRKRELHFRNTVTQLMIIVQDYLRKQLIDPHSASQIMEGILEECVKASQHDMAHLLFRAFLRFRKYGCEITVTALRHVFDSYKGTENREMMMQLASEMKEDPQLRAFCIAAFLFAGAVDEAEALRRGIPPELLTCTDLIAIIEGYEKLGEKAKVLEVIDSLPALKFSAGDLTDIFQASLRLMWKDEDDPNFDKVWDAMLKLQVVPNAATFATALRVKLRRGRSVEDVGAVEQELKGLGYIPDMTGNSVIIAAYARLMHYGDRGSEEVMLAKVDTLLSSIESRLKQGDPDMDISAAHLRAVLRGYGAAGRPELMKSAWDRMQYKGLSNDTRVYNEMIKWYSLMGNVKDVLRIKEEMLTNGVHADAKTYTWVFRALGKWYPRQIERYYQEMQSTRVRPDITLYSTLLGVFGDLQQFDRVDAVTEDIRRREEAGTVPVSPHTYSQLIRVFGHDLDKVDALYREAQSKSVADHPHVLTVVLHAYATHPEGQPRMDILLASLPQWNANVFNVLLHMYGKRNDKEKVNELVERMRRERVEFNDVTFGTLVTTYGRWKEMDKVHEVIEMLKQREGTVSANFYSILASTYSRLGDSEAINDAWDDLLSSKLFPDTEVYNQFLALYGKHNNVAKMQTVMDNMLKQVPPNPLTATTVLDMLGKSGRIHEMETLFEDMGRNADTAPTVVTYHQAMNAYAKTGDVNKMEKLRDEMVSKGMKENNVTFNILADGYGRAKRFEQLVELVQRRKQLEIPMDELGYCVLVAAYGRVRLGTEVARLAADVRADKDPHVLTRKVVWALIDAFCRCNEVTHMQNWIEELPKYLPNAATAVPSLDGATGTGEGMRSHPAGELTAGDLSALIAYYCRAGLLDRVEENVRLIEAKGHDVPFNALNAMARGYARVGRFDKVVEVLHKMRDRNFVPDASTALQLSGAFLKAGLHEQAQQIVQWRRQYARSHVEESEEPIV